MKELRLYTPVAIPKSPFSIGMDDRVMLIGSCFTENMGQRMLDAGFTVSVNPYGILYNPLSMAESLRRILVNEPIGEESLVCHDGLWHSWLHHGSFSCRDKEECVANCNRSTRQAHDFMSECNTLIVTLGSAWCYFLRDGGLAVANCHKVPDNRFDKRLVTVDEVVRAWRPLITELLNRNIRLVFTISPVRHSAYGAHGNQLGKAVLLLAVEALIEMCRGNGLVAGYFPAYEIVVDELRDYRFYADDMSHPSPLAEKIVWHRFQECFMTEETVSSCEAADKERRRSAHRPIHEM